MSTSPDLIVCLQGHTGIHTGFSAKGGGETGGRVGLAAIVEWLSLEKVIDLDDKQRTKLKSLLISKISSGVWGGGEIRCLGVGIPGLPPSV